MSIPFYATMAVLFYLGWMSNMVFAFGPYQKLKLFGSGGNHHHNVRHQSSCQYGPYKLPSFTTSGRSSSASSLSMGMQINIRIVGRNKSGSDKWLEDACTMYEQRLRPSNLEVQTTWHKDNATLMKGIDTDQQKGYQVVLLDPLGKSRTSEQFTEDMYQWLDEGGSRLVFVIGGADGLPYELKFPQKGKTRPKLLSLSQLTFTHQFARVLLIEQIYRASEIRKGSNYHK